MWNLQVCSIFHFCLTSVLLARESLVREVQQVEKTVWTSRVVSSSSPCNSTEQAEPAVAITHSKPAYSALFSFDLLDLTTSSSCWLKVSRYLWLQFPPQHRRCNVTLSFHSGNLPSHTGVSVALFACFNVKTWLPSDQTIPINHKPLQWKRPELWVAPQFFFSGGFWGFSHAGGFARRLCKVTKKTLNSAKLYYYTASWLSLYFPSTFKHLWLIGAPPDAISIFSTHMLMLFAHANVFGHRPLALISLDMKSAPIMSHQRDLNLDLTFLVQFKCD